MNSFVVTLLSQKPCELNRFLSRYYHQKVQVEEGAFCWYSPLPNALESSLLLATLIDNLDDYMIEAYLSVNHQQNIKVNPENMTGIIKYLYLLDKN